MSAERRKVLELLAEGKITAEDAERLLTRLAASEEGEGPGELPEEEPSAAGAAGRGRAPLKFLRVIADAADGDKINIRVPLALVRTGIKLSTMLPAEAHRKLAERGIDLSQLSGLEGEELIEALRELRVDVDSTAGDSVRIFCE